MYVFSSQIKQAADSVVLNIHERSTGQFKKEFGRYPEIALRSAIEALSLLYLAERKEPVRNGQFQGINIES